MFAGSNPSYNCSTPSSNDSIFEYHSFDSSLSPSESDSSTASWDPALLTPISIPRRSSDSGSPEDGYFPPSTPFRTPSGYDNGAYFSPGTIMTEELLSELQYPVVPPLDYNEASAMSFNHGLPLDMPSLDEFRTPNSSPSSTGFVVPSQTTFATSFDVDSPYRPINSKVELQYDSPQSEYSNNSSPVGNMPYIMSLPYSKCRSASTTSSQASTISQPRCEPLSSSAALHRVQGSQAPPTSRLSTSRLARRRTKREVQDCILPGSIRVQKEAKQECRWEGCKGKKFQRKEHLRRHERSVHLGHAIQCRLCDRPFNRTDNLKQHYKLHAQMKKKGARTDYYPEAQRLVDEMERKPRKAGEWS